MKKLLSLLTCSSILFTLNVFGEESKQESKPPQRRRLPKELLEKYDINKDGKLDKEEREKISKEDLKKFRRPPGKRSEDKK